MECTYINMYLSYNIYLVSTAKYTFFYIRYSRLVFFLIYYRVLYNNYYGET